MHHRIFSPRYSVGTNHPCRSPPPRGPCPRPPRAPIARHRRLPPGPGPAGAGRAQPCVLLRIRQGGPWLRRMSRSDSRTGSLSSTPDLRGGALLPFLHEADGSLGGLGPNQQVKVLGHEHPSQQEESRFLAELAQSLDPGPAEALTPQEPGAAISAGGYKLQLARLETATTHNGFLSGA